MPRPGLGELAGEPGAERRLRDAIDRLSRRPQGWVVLALHLSRLRPPAPRPHHRRVAQVLLHDVAERHEGQVFGLRSGDIALLCHAEALGQTLRRGGASLTDTLARLLQVDAPDPARIMSVWSLLRDHLALDRYLTHEIDSVAPVMDDTALPAATQAAQATQAIDALAAGIEGAGIAELGQRQIGVRIGAGKLIPAYREIAFSIAALQARIAFDGPVELDPYLFRHLAGRLDRAMLKLLRQELGSCSPLDAAAPGPVLHVNLTPAAILSDGFARFVESCGRYPRRIGVEIALLDAIGDPDAFIRARQVLDRADMALVLEGICHLTLQLCAPEALDSAMLKLDWSPHILALPMEGQRALAGRLREIDPVRLVLQRADSEDALRWGLAHGITCFQGRHVDVMLAAARMLTCEQAGACALGQCVDRASVAGLGGRRRQCRNPGLLDLGLLDLGLADAGGGA